MTTLVGYLICTPLSELWTHAPGGKCGNTTAAYVSLGVLDVLLDMAVFSLPVPMLYRLQVARHAKIALLATFGMGLFTIAAGIMRLVAVIQIDYMINFEEAQVGDAYWCAIESSVGITVACAMTLRPLLDRLLAALSHQFPRFFSAQCSRRSGDHNVNLQSPKIKSDTASFMRLNEGQDLPLEALRLPQPILGRQTKRAAIELV